MSEEEVDECLAALIEAASDGEAVFHAAAANVRSEEARALLLDRARRCSHAAAVLRALARERGSPPAAPGVRDLHRHVQADEAELLAAAERVESAVIIAYRDALDRPLPAAIRRLVAAEFERLLASLGTLGAARERAARQRRLVVGRLA
jgi:uncharacterized protein (TIGR02284 family)